MSRFNFMAPATTASTGGFAFGAAKPATTGFGLGASPSGGGLTFGTPATSAPSFGSSFGTPASTSFGAPTGFGFGATTSSAPATGLTFGSNTTTAPVGGLNFGAPATGGLNFGAPVQGGLNFGAPAAGGLNFGAPAPAQGLGGFNFGGTTATTSAPASTLSFPFGGGLTNTPATISQSFGLGTTATGLFGKPATTLGGLTDASKPPTSSVSLGLGGIDTSATGGGLPGSNISGIGIASSAGNTGSAQAGGPAPKSVPLPNELLTVVESFKNNVRQRKQASSDIARSSIRPLKKVSSEADIMLRTTTELSALLTQQRRTATGLRSRAAASLPAAERAHRVFETPHGLEYESSDAVNWITGVVAEGETTLRLLKHQLEAVQRQLETPSKPVTDQELALGMRRIHESFVAVAGRLQAVHQLVEAQKAQYLSLRRNVLKDPTDVFADKNGSGGGAVSTSLCLDWMGKSSVQLPSAVVADPLMALGLPQNKSLQVSGGPNPFTYLDPPGFSGLPLGFSGKPGTTGSAATNTLSNTSWGVSSNTSGGMGLMGGLQSPLSAGGGLSGLASNDPIGFALQKPPAGNKRGKH